MDENKLILIALILLFLGFALPLFMILGIMDSTYLLNFLAYGSSVLGLFLGIVASARIVIRSRNKK